MFEDRQIVDLGILHNVQRPNDQFERKRCQKKRKDVEYKFIFEFFQKYSALHERWAVKFVQCICMLCLGRFILIESVDLGY